MRIRVALDYILDFMKQVDLFCGRKSFSEDREISVICGHRHKKLFLDMDNIKLYRSPVGYLG
jgi:hypothetical protein